MCVSPPSGSFQKVQGLPPIQAAIRFLPNVITGVVLNFVTGLLAHRLRADYLVIGTTFLSAASPLLMAIIQVQWSFWTCAFWATMIIPLSAGGKSFFLCVFSYYPLSPTLPPCLSICSRSPAK